MCEGSDLRKRLWETEATAPDTSRTAWPAQARVVPGVSSVVMPALSTVKTITRVPSNGPRSFPQVSQTAPSLTPVASLSALALDPEPIELSRRLEAAQPHQRSSTNLTLSTVAARPASGSFSMPMQLTSQPRITQIYTPRK